MNSSENKNQEFIWENRIKIGDALREIREKKATVRITYLKLKVDRSTISKIKNGRFSFNIDYLSKFSYFLKFEFKFNEFE